MLKIIKKLISKPQKRRFSIRKTLFLALAFMVAGLSLFGVSLTSTIPKVFDFEKLEEIRKITPQAEVGINNYNYYKFVSDHEKTVSSIIIAVGGLLCIVFLILAFRKKGYNNIHNQQEGEAALS